jgi:hypothetical protein
LFKNFENTITKKLAFARANSRPPRMPSWMANSAAIDASIGPESLRPPRVPTGLTDPPGEAPQSEQFDGSTDAELRGFDATLLDVGVAERSEKSADTFVEELSPRTEDEAISAVTRAVERLTEARSAVLRESEEQLVQLVSAIARRVVAREVSLDPSIVRGLVREGIGALGERDRVLVRVGHFFAAAIDDLREELLASGTRAEVLVDEALGETGCSIETDLGQVDESIEARMAALLEVMTQTSLA